MGGGGIERGKRKREETSLGRDYGNDVVMGVVTSVRSKTTAHKMIYNRSS